MVSMNQPGVFGLREAVVALGDMQSEVPAVQLHPGDLGWNWRFGAEATAAGVRTWAHDGRILAVGMLDGPRLLRLAISPEAQHDEQLAGQMIADITQPVGGVLPQGDVSIEARLGDAFRRSLSSEGWEAGESWTPLRCDFTQPARCGLRVEVVGSDRARLRAAVQRAAFPGSTFTEERWHAMAAGLPYADARCLLAYDDQGFAVAAVTVWSAGPGRPGLLEPMGVHHNHRGRGYGRAICVAAAAALRDMGSSSASVGTPSSNVGAVATYRSAGFQPLPEVHDFHRAC
jgi:ribosomal protein S18 acetylase RimI-like enzyme